MKNVRIGVKKKKRLTEECHNDWTMRTFIDELLDDGYEQSCANRRPDVVAISWIWFADCMGLAIE